MADFTPTQGRYKRPAVPCTDSLSQFLHLVIRVGVPKSITDVVEGLRRGKPADLYPLVGNPKACRIAANPQAS
jgi:hypothetical protein